MGYSRYLFDGIIENVRDISMLGCKKIVLFARIFDRCDQKNSNIYREISIQFIENSRYNIENSAIENLDKFIEFSEGAQFLDIYIEFLDAFFTSACP
jgi:3-phosphoglycerate kinase